MESDNKLFLLDAYALIYRAYYAFIKNPRINSKGFNTSAILGFVNTLEEVLKKENPSHIGVAFDPSGPTFRHEAFEQYKAQREETPEAIRLSVPIIKDIIHAYRIPILEVAGYEADDVIGTLATEAGRQGITTYMMTPDKDYGQLVTDNVFMYRPKHTGGFEVMGIEEVKAKFDIQSPAQVIDMLGLMGDASDNIPGCPGVGEKTAQKLIAEFGNIENLLEHTDQLKGALKTKVETNKELITFSKFLATIKIDVPIQLEMDKLIREQADEDSLRQIFEELEFRTLIDRVLKKENSAADYLRDSFLEVNAAVNYNLNIAGTYAERGLAAGVSGLHHCSAAGRNYNVNAVHEGCCRVHGALLNGLYEVLGKSELLQLCAEQVDNVFVGFLRSGVRSYDDSVLTLECEHRIAHRGNYRVSNRSYGANNALCLSNTDNSGLLVLADDTYGLLAL